MSQALEATAFISVYIYIYKRENISQTNLPAGCFWGSVHNQVISQVTWSVFQLCGSHRRSSSPYPSGEVCYGTQEHIGDVSRRAGLRSWSLSPAASAAAVSQKCWQGLMDVSLHQGITVCNTAFLNPFWQNLCPSASPLLFLLERNIWPRIRILEAENVFM